PGWHIECSAMSMKYLGEHIDIHTGGVDNIFPHHEGEIAQSEGAFGHQVVRYWVHCQHVLASGQKMAKSAGNAYTMTELEDRGFESLAYRYLCLTARYRSRLNFTFTALVAAQRALDRLRRRAATWNAGAEATTDGADPADGEIWRSRFWAAINDDLATPAALALTWMMAADESLSGFRKLALLLEFDQVFGVGIESWLRNQASPSTSIRQDVQRREDLRKVADYDAADRYRADVLARGFVIEDGQDAATAVLPAPHGHSPSVVRLARAVPSPKVVPSRLGEPSDLDLSVVVNAVGWPVDVSRVVNDALRYLGDRPSEVIAIDNGSFDGTWEALDAIAREAPTLRVIHTDHFLGEAAGRNIGMKLARGRVIVSLDPSVGLDGDIFGPALAMLENHAVGLVGTWGLITENFKDFTEVEDGEVDALQAYCFALRREDLRQVGLMDERFVFYRNLDVDFSFQFREHGFKVIAVQSLPVSRYVHRVWEELAPDEREKKSRKNWARFFEKYHHRQDLLVTPGALGYQHPDDGAGSGHEH
ncbi:MAG: glycosyltransferase, partial [Chloroflexi bacterium]|nr:glycosyltransferase [Chloroflexota bacterium]